MVEYGNAEDLRSVLLICITLMMFLTFPGISLPLWKTLSRKWAAHRSKKICKRKKGSAEKLKKYWEIDMGKFK